MNCWKVMNPVKYMIKDIKKKKDVQTRTKSLVFMKTQKILI